MKRIFLFFFVILSAACSKIEIPEPGKTDVTESEDGRGEIVQWALNGDASLHTIDQLCGAFPKDSLFYSVSCYKLVYTTKWVDSLVNASALVLVPDGISSGEIVAYFHGTALPDDIITDFSDYAGGGMFSTRIEIAAMALAFASNGGYAVVIPDYVGYGTTSDLEHPYTYYPELSKGNIDAIIAAGKLLDRLEFRTSDGIYLTGWSQGGGAALAAQYYIEKDYSDRLKVKATSALAGPYDFEAFMDYIMSSPDKYFLGMSAYGWAAYTLNHFSPLLQRPDDQVFRKNVFDQNSALFSGVTTANELFTPLFVDGYVNGSDEALSDAIRENTFARGWSPVGYVFLHHGDSDNIVPYINSRNAFEGLKGSGNVALYTYQGGTHTSLLKPYVKTTISDFQKL